MTNKRFLLCVAVAVAMLAFIPPPVHEHVAADPTYETYEIEAAKESIALSLLGQLQLSIGDLMWMKSMEYLHVGVVQRMPTRAEEARGYRRHDARDVAAGMGHTEGVNMTLDSERDFRGIFGEIERHIVPYSREHIHDDPVEIIPWYQLAVKLNPRLERLYTMGAFFMADFAHEPGEARELLEAGLRANPQSWEIRATLGRLFVDYAHRLDELEHDDHEEDHDDDDHREVESDQEAYAYAVELLREAVDMAQEHRRQLAEKRQVFDDFQNQILGESFLYLSKAHVGLGQFEEGLQAAEEGFTVASQYPNRNLLRVQQRIAERAMRGEQAEPSDLMSIARARDNAGGERGGANNVNADPVQATIEPTLPVSIVLGIPAPERAEIAEAPPQARALLTDIRAYPLESLSQRINRLGITPSECAAAAQALETRKFIANAGGEHLDELSVIHHLTPIGLYVELGHFGFDFWDVMHERAAELAATGIDVDLMRARRVSPGRDGLDGAQEPVSVESIFESIQGDMNFHFRGRRDDSQ